MTDLKDILADKVTSAKRKASSYISVADDEDEDLTLAQELSQEIQGLCPTMTLKQRWYAFGICFCTGWFISFLSVITVGSIATNPGRFAFIYTAGSLCSIGSTCFLWGPCRQCKRMFKLHRMIATSVYLGAMG